MDKRHRNCEHESRQAATSAAAHAARDSSPSSPSTTTVGSHQLLPSHSHFAQSRHGDDETATGRSSGQIEVGESVGRTSTVSVGHEDARSSERKRESEGAAGRKTRVEGRGSSAAQRAAASEACKSITLDALQAQYYRPLSDVAKDSHVSVARLLKKCREFGILRWPYRHVRSVQESIMQLERDREAATDPVAIEEMDLRLGLLRRRGELVMHFASCGLESDMRKGIFLADPRDVDNMIEKAHEANGRRRPPKGWDGLGQFPDRQVREHFLEQLRAHMIGGGSSGLSAPDSPRGRSRPPEHDYRTVPPPGRQPQWQSEQPQPQPSPSWQQSRHLYPREVEQAHSPYPSSYWGGPHGAGVSGPGGVGPGGGGGVVHGGGAVGVGFGRVQSAGRADYPTSEPARYPPPPSASWLGPNAPIAAGHHPLDGRAKPEPLRSLQQDSPVGGYHNMHSGPRGTGGGGTAGVGSRAGGAVEIRDGYPGAWDGGVGGRGSSVSAEHGERGDSHRESWHQTGRLSPQSSHLVATARRCWATSDLPDPSERGISQSGPATLPSIFERHGHLNRPPGFFLPPTAGGGMPQQGAPPTSVRPTRPVVVEEQSVGPGAIGGGSGGGSNSAIESGVPRESQWSGDLQEPPAVTFDNRWGTSEVLDRRAPPPPPTSRRVDTIPTGRNGVGASRMPARSRPDPSSPAAHPSASRFPVMSAPGGTPGPRGGAPVTGSPSQPSVPRDPPWSGSPRVALPESFGDRRYGGPTIGSSHPVSNSAEGAEHGSGPRQVPSSAPTSRDASWSQQQRDQVQDGHQEQHGAEGPRRMPSKAPQDSHY